MSYIKAGQAGLSAVEAKKWTEGIAQLSEALKQSKNPTWLNARSKAHIGTRQFQEALHDAELAWHSAFDRANRKEMVDAQYRRAVAYYRLGQHANADCCLSWALDLADGRPANDKDRKADHIDENGDYNITDAEAAEFMSTATKGNEFNSPGGEMQRLRSAAAALRIQNIRALGKLEKGAAGRKADAGRVPDKRQVVEKSTERAAAPEPKATVPNNLRIDFYQSVDVVTVSVYVKGVDAKDFSVDFLPSQKDIVLKGLPKGNGQKGSYHLHLWSEVNEAESKFRVASVKVELTLKKASLVKWPALYSSESTSGWAGDDDGGEPVSVGASSAASSNDTPSTTSSSASTTAKPEEPKAAAAEPASKPPSAGPPSYPTSSRKGPKNWDSINDDDGDEDEAAHDADHWFQKLYAGGTEEQKRAMMKSFVESNGTTLSTDWSDVGSRTVATNPPDGVVAKKWDS